MTCPGALPLKDKLRLTSKTSSYANAGTAMHDVAEQCLSGGMEPEEFVGEEFVFDSGDKIKITDDMAEISKVFVDYVRSLDGDKFYEERVHVSVVENCFGTADAIVFDPDEKSMEVVDLKTGAGVRVDAHENTQLLCYALGAYLDFGVLYEVETVRATIIQPPFGDTPSTYETDLEGLLAFAEKIKAAVRRMEDEPDTFVPSEKACKFCACKAHCPGLHKESLSMAQKEFADVKIQDEFDLSFWMKKIPVVEAFIKEVKAEVHKRLTAGEAVDEFKLVAGRNTRVWVDEKTLQEELEVMYDEDVFMQPAVLKSVAQMEKALKEEDFDLKPHIFIKKGSPVIAHESNPKPAVDPNKAAAEDFKKL